MSINSVRLKDLRNEEHYQLHTDVRELIEKTGAAQLGIASQYTAWASLLTDEGVAINKIIKSSYTERLIDADGARDSVGKGLVTVVEGSLNHFNPATREAARRVKIILDKYAGFDAKPYDQETASINLLVDELLKSAAADLALLHLTEWVPELKTRNDNFVAIAAHRYDEDETRTTLVAKEVRTVVDEKFKAMIKRFEAVVEVNEDKDYSGFITALNLRMDHYNNVLAQRAGRHASKSAKADAATPQA